MKSDSSNQCEESYRDSLPLLKELSEQTRLLAEIRSGVELDPCLLDKIGRIACLTANEVHQNTLQLKAIRQSLEALVEMYRTANPAAALELDRLAKLRAEIERCCPPEETCEKICHYVPCERHGGIKRGDGYSAMSHGYVDALVISRAQKPWRIVQRPRHEADKDLPGVALGDFVAQIVPSPPTPKPQDFRSGSPTPPGAQGPVGFRTFTQTELAENWPPDMSGARGGDVVLMSGNLWLKISVDGGKTLSDLDFTKLFDEDKTYGGWAGDQVVHYIPAIDCFVLYVQSWTGKGDKENKNVVKVALASQADLKKFAGGRAAWWRQWDFTPDTFGLGSSWMDFPDITYGQNFLHVNTHVFAAKTGKLFFELPLADMQAGKGLDFLFAFIDDNCGSPAQNVDGDDFYWAAHVGNSKMRIFSHRGGDPNYAWREREVVNWPRVDDKDPNKMSSPKRPTPTTGSARTTASLARRAWARSCGLLGPPHPAMAVTAELSFHSRMCRWSSSTSRRTSNVSIRCRSGTPDHAYGYACLTTNSDNEVGISLAWGGGPSLYGSHAVGILGFRCLVRRRERRNGAAQKDWQ